MNFFPFCLALSLEGNHEDAIKVREGETLEIYRKHLGDRHPFTATILNNLSNNYSALGEGREEFKDAKAYLRECESMQRVLDDPTMISELERLVYTVTL